MLNILPFIIAICLPLYLIRFSIFGIPTTFFEIIVWLTLIIYLLLKVDLTTKIKRLNILLKIGIVLFIVGAFIGLYISEDKVRTLGLIKGFLITPLLASLVVYSSPNEGKKSFYFGLISLLIILSLHILFQLLIGDLTVDGRALGVYGVEDGASPNYFALFVVPIICLLEAKLVLKSKTNFVAFEYVILILGVLAVYATHSRAGLGAIALILLLAIWSKLKTRYKNKITVNIISLIILTLVLAGVYIVAKPDLNASSDSGRVSTSNNIRYEIWKTTIQDILPKYWLTGVGLGNYQNQFKELTNGRVNYNEYISPRALTPHNLELAVWVNFGLVGLIGFLLIIISFFINSNWQSIWFYAFLAILLLGIFDTPFFKNDLALMFWLALFYSTNNKLSNKNNI